MKYAIERSIHAERLTNILFNKFEPWSAQKVLDVFAMASDQVIECNDFMSALFKTIAEV